MLGREQISGKQGGTVVTQGLILLALIAAFFAFVTTRVRRRLGLSVSGRTWVVAMLVVIVIVLALWNGSSR